MRKNRLEVLVYDPKSEAHEFVAENRDAAIKKACEYYQVEVDALEIGAFPEGDVYGLGGRSVVVARLPGRRPEARPAGRRDREGGGRDRDRDRDGPRSSGNTARRGRDDSPRDRSRGRGRGESARRPEEPRRSAPTEPSVGTTDGKLGEVGEYVLGLIERMDLGPFEIAENMDGELVIFEIRGAAATELARGEGRSVDAIQLLANQAAMQLDDDAPRVVVDIEGSAEARESLLDRLAKRVARRARESGRSVALDPMNARDRRLVHVALRDEDEVATMSMGEGRYRQVLVVPSGAPEFEEASRESDSAGDRGD